MKTNYTNQTSFTGARKSYQTYDNSRNFFDKNDTIKILRESIAPEYKHGEGFLSKVYSIQGNDDFMLRVDKFQKEPLKNITLKPEKDYFPEFNLGQKIATLNNFASIIIKQSGEPCGIKHFINNHYQPVNETDVPTFIKYLEKVSLFPQESYNDFASEIKTIHKRQHMFDFVNSQNVLFDEKSKSFNIVDIMKRWTTKFLNCDIVMPMALLDFQNYSKLINLADESQKNQIYDYSKKIIDKSYQAYYHHNKFSQHLMIDFYANFIGINNGRALTNEFFKMKKLIKTMSSM